MSEIEKPNKEEVYDSEISPHIAAILDICKREHIAMIASFAIPTDADPDLSCTSMLPDENGNPREHQIAERAIRGLSVMLPMRIATRSKDGRIISEEVVIP